MYGGAPRDGHFGTTVGRLGSTKEESVQDEESRKIRMDLLMDKSSHPGYSLEGE